LKTATTTRHASLSEVAQISEFHRLLRRIGYSIRLLAEVFFKTGARYLARLTP